MVYPTLKRRRWPLALLAGGVALTASMMTAPALAAELPSGGDDDQPLALVNANASESGASAADELAAVAVAGEPQGPAVDMNSGPSTGVGASADPAAEQKTDEKSIDAAVDVQVPAQQQGQAASAKAAAADGVAPVAKAPAPAETGYTGWAVEDRNNGYGLQRYWMVNGRRLPPRSSTPRSDTAPTGHTPAPRATWCAAGGQILDRLRLPRKQRWQARGPGLGRELVVWPGAAALLGRREGPRRGARLFL